MFVTWCALLTSMWLAASSQAPGTPQPPVVRETVEVVATKLPEAPHDVPQSIEVFTGEDLRTLGATSLKDALSLAAGVAIAPGGDGGPASAVPEFWGLREFDAFLLVVDDVPRGGAFNPALASVSMRDVERVEVLRGAAPVTYGATSFVGIIHVVHKASAASRSYASVSGGSYGTGGVAADLALPSAGEWSSRLSVDVERQGFRDDRTSFSRGHALYRAGKSVGGSRTWFTADLTVLRQDPASPRPRQGRALSALVPVDANQNPEGAFIDENRFAASFGIDRGLGGDRRLGATASVTRSGEERFRGFLSAIDDTPGNAIGLRQNLDLTDIYADVHLTLRDRGAVRFVAGGDLLHGQGDSRGATFGYTAPLAGASAPRVSEPADLPRGAESSTRATATWTSAIARSPNRSRRLTRASDIVSIVTRFAWTGTT